ncbi:Forkhead domain containing protein [Pyrenophora tritici-repentis]|nr:Forkhead domain containing protein [Pyrenophora tritici-repentis]
MPHVQSPHRPSSADLCGSFDTTQSSKDAIGATLPLHTPSPLLSLPSRLSVDVPTMSTAVQEPTPSRNQDPHSTMSFNGQEPMQWATHTNFMFTPIGQDCAGYNTPNPLPLGNSGDFYHYAQNGMSYNDNYSMAFPTQGPSSSCPRSYNSSDLITIPRENCVVDSYPPTAYHIEPPKNHDALDLSDHGINDQLMQLSNDYDHHQYGSHMKIEDPTGYQSPYSDLTRASTPGDDPPGHADSHFEGHGGNFDKEQPYAQLIYQALMNAPDHTMILRDIYDWFKNNTDKANDSGTKGWQNSIRHNLSMNGAFEKVDHPSEASRKGFMWRLTDQAILEGVKSTTRYRSKQPNKRGPRNHQPQPQRQASGAKGGKASRRSARMRSARMQDTYLNPHYMSRSVPSAFDPRYQRPDSSMSYTPSTHSSSDMDFSYGPPSKTERYTSSPLHSHHSHLDIFSRATARPYMVNHHPMTHGLPISDTGYVLDQSPTESLFTNSPSPSADEPRTPVDQGCWQEDVDMGPTCVFDEQIAYREYAG